ncbi:hypothetical protein ACFE04_003675 [Oxalis oulophora]
MDWGNVTTEDLIDALREVDWSSPPRPFSEFFSRFTLPRSATKWNSRLKCNLYYYRANYFLLILIILALGFLTRPLAIVAAILTSLSIAILNDRPVIRGRPSAKRRAVHICGRPRWVFVLIFSSVSFILWYVSCGLLTVSWALAFGLLATFLHASFRTPNLKARLNTFREEFRAVWRNYSDLSECSIPKWLYMQELFDVKFVTRVFKVAGWQVKGAGYREIMNCWKGDHKKHKNKSSDQRATKSGGLNLRKKGQYGGAQGGSGFHGSGPSDGGNTGLFTGIAAASVASSDMASGGACGGGGYGGS